MAGTIQYCSIGLQWKQPQPQYNQAGSHDTKSNPLIHVHTRKCARKRTRTLNNNVTPYSTFSFGTMNPARRHKQKPENANAHEWRDPALDTVNTFAGVTTPTHPPTHTYITLENSHDSSQPPAPHLPDTGTRSATSRRQRSSSQAPRCSAPSSWTSSAPTRSHCRTRSRIGPSTSAQSRQTLCRSGPQGRECTSPRLRWRTGQPDTVQSRCCCCGTRRARRCPLDSAYRTSTRLGKSHARE